MNGTDGFDGNLVYRFIVQRKIKKPLLRKDVPYTTVYRHSLFPLPRILHLLHVLLSGPGEDECN